MKLYLASTSPRRRDMLARRGIPFEAVAPQFEEIPTRRPVREEVLYFAEQKARSVAALYPEALILGCDTMIECEGRKIGKPSNAEEAVAILSFLSGKTHIVSSAAVLLNTKTNSMRTGVEQTKVTFRNLSAEEIRSYAATEEPRDKAGAYALQGEGRKFVAKIQGNEEVVIGLPLFIFSLLVRECGLKEE